MPLSCIVTFLLHLATIVSFLSKYSFPLCRVCRAVSSCHTVYVPSCQLSSLVAGFPKGVLDREGGEPSDTHQVLSAGGQLS